MTRAVWWAGAAFAALLGFSRISFGLLLPFIKHEFPASYTAYGIVAAANFAGYLVGLVAIPLVPRRFHDRRSNTIAMALIAITLALSAIAPSLALLAGARFVNGIAQAVGTILTIGLTLSLVETRLRGRASGIVWGGGAVGIALCALGLPFAAVVVNGWRAIWIIMALLSAIAAVGLHRVLPERALDTTSGDLGPTSDRPAIAILAAQYALFGAAFALYFTYAPAFARDIIAGTGAFALAWFLTGIAGIAGGSVWGHWLDRSRRGLTLGACLGLAGVGAAALLFHNPFAGACSAIVVGGCAFGTPAQTAALVRRFSSGADYMHVLSIVTIAFAIGQTIGAPLGGAIADAQGLAASVLTSAAFFALAGVTALAIALRSSTSA